MSFKKNNPPENNQEDMVEPHAVNPEPKKPSNIIVLVFYFLLLTLCLGIAFYVATLFISSKFNLPGLNIPKPPGSETKADQVEIKQFESAQEMKTFLENGEDLTSSFGGGIPVAAGGSRENLSVDMALESAPGTGMGKSMAGPNRVSQTNVQVRGIDEPDIVKTDGQQIYFSSDLPTFRAMPAQPEPMLDMVEEKMMMPPYQRGESKVIAAFPPANLKQIGQIEVTGQLLLDDKTLIVLGNDNKLYGFDISDPQNPEQTWQIKMENNTYLDQARFYDGQIYLVTKTHLDRSNPCPIRPLTIEDEKLSITCTDIYYPDTDLYADTTYTTWKIDPQTGEVDNKVSFVGSSNSSVTYMSTQNLYITYTYQGDMVDFIYKFFNEEGSDLIPADTLQRINKLRDYDISQRAKMTELGEILNDFQRGLSRDERLKLENELSNRMSDFSAKNMRNMSRSGITKIDLDDLKVQASGSVPGHPLNQFSLDEYEGNLRLATSIEPAGFWGMGMGRGGNSDSANDLYVLDKNLNIVGSVKNLGLGERIYSARFIADKGYLVTFRQIDPFYIFDLSDPKNPQKTGELKIPGYSSYLHALYEDVILGVGQEDRQVKLSMFDVSNSSQPKEMDKYLLDEHWTEVENNHRAFLQDDKHKIFFIPGSKGGYVFSYKNNKLVLQTALSGISAKRAIFINDYLYIIGENKIVVYNENDWTQVNELEFAGSNPPSFPEPRFQIEEPTTLPLIQEDRTDDK